jgi:hypothetical protein
MGIRYKLSEFCPEEEKRSILEFAKMKDGLKKQMADKTMGSSETGLTMGTGRGGA